MNTSQRELLYQKILEYLTIPIGNTHEGRPIYPTLLQTAFKFNFSVNHIFRLKKTFLGLDKDIQGRQDMKPRKADSQ